MKKVFLLVFTALAALMAASCQKEEMGRVLTATIEQYEHNSKDGNDASKAYINNDYYACWENGDTVSINGIKYPISIPEGTQGTANTATINGASLPTGQNLLAYYPASQVTDWNGNNVTISLPQVQEYRENDGHQVINNPMAAYCPDGGTELRFRNLAALLKVTITAPDTQNVKISKILVKGNDNQMLWGTAQLTLDNQDKPMLGEMSNGSATATLSFPSPVTIRGLDSKSFYIVVPAGSNFFNFTIVVATDREAYKKTSKINQTLPRNHIGALTYDPTDDEKLLPIFYEGIIQGFNTNAFGGAQVLSSDNGIILFDRPLTTLGDNAFYGRRSLTSISLPAGLTSIGNYAFEECSSLNSISLPESLTSIGVYAFMKCSSLDSISLPANLTSIGHSVFRECSSLISISLPANLTSIGQNAFMDCSSLGSISLPESMTSIGHSAFRGCSGLTSISLPESLTSIGQGVFMDCSGLTSISLPDSLTSIGTDAFRDCSGLTSISLPESMTSIGDCAFAMCTSLATVYAYKYDENGDPKITQIDNQTFDGCQLTRIYVPSDAVDTYKNAPGWSQYSDIISEMPTE